MFNRIKVFFRSNSNKTGHSILSIKKILFYFSIIFFPLLAYLSLWCVISIGDVSVEKIIFHLFLPLKKAHTEWITDIYWPFVFTVLTVVFLLYIGRLSDKNKRPVLMVLCFFVLFDCIFINKHFSVYDFIKSQMSYSDFIEKNYVFPNFSQISFPKNKKNLIIVMVESLESSYQDKENGGLLDENYIPELTKLAKNNISFSHSDKIEGALVPPEAGWTIAATIAQTAGIPLKLYGPFVDDRGRRELDNGMGKYENILPGAIALGDILKENGYKNYYILGTDAGFAGKRDYMRQHGGYDVIDSRKITAKREKTTVYDKDLFEFSKGKILEISKKKKPFSILIQTIDTHFGNKQDFKNLSAEVESFITWLIRQKSLKNTTIIVVGDHCNMNQKDFAGIENENFRAQGNSIRKVYNAFINSSVVPQKQFNRKFSTFDMFPTMLASIGVKIEGNRLGLGTNLFSNEKTLLEIYDPDYVFEELRKKSRFYNRKLLFKGFSLGNSKKQKNR